MIEHMEQRPHVAVIGGGFAGAAAASALTEAGVSVTLIEARATLGGRASSIRDGVMKQDVDNGQHMFLGSYRDTRAFLKRLGVADRLSFQDAFGVSFINRSGKPSGLRPMIFPGTAGLLAGVLGFQELGWKDRLSLLWGLARARWAGVDRLQQKTVSAWLTKLRQTHGARRAFWDPLCYATLNERPDRAGAAFLWTVLREGLFQGGRTRALGHATLPLGRLWGVELAAYLKRQDGIAAPRQKATGFRVQERRVTAVHVEGESDMEADAFILATDLSTAVAIAPEPLRESLHPLESQDHAPIASVNFWFSRSPFAQAFVGLLDMDLHWIYNREILWGSGARGQVSAVVSAARNLESRSSDELISLALADIRRAFPDFREEPSHATVLWERRATPSPTPRFYSERPGVETPLSNFFLAGDWVNVGLPPTIEAACRSGHRAAARTLDALGRRPSAQPARESVAC